jgi:hypothetical protein
MGLLSAGPMKSVQSLIDRRQEIEPHLHAIGMRQSPSQTVKSPDGHLVIHTPFDIQDLKKRVRLKSQLAQIDLKLGPAKPVKKSVPQRTTTITNGGSELITEQLLAQRWFCSTSRLQRWRMDEKGPSYLKIGGKVLYRLEDVRLYKLSCRVKTAASS